MNEPAVRVDRVGKRYQIGGLQSGYGTLREALVSAAQESWQLLRNGGQRRERKEFWALKDVSFEVGQGEVLGIIGRNGAGKSTLLKILARVTRPTSGRAEISGRVGSLLEVGTGFHPELSGRENIFLNGAILGMKRAEILEKFDAIVDFAEIEKFLDTPVKRYSSGMYMRLAFSIAAHLDPEILIVDEVLAVGDAAFQKKSLGKMGNVAREGRTVLFVSHNMPAVISLCDRAMLLESGQLIAEGSPESIVQQYLEKEMATSIIPLDQRQDRMGDGTARLEYLQIESTDPDKIIRSGSRLKLTIGYRSDRPVQRPQFVVSVYDHMETGIFLLHNDFVGGLPESLPPKGSVTCLTEPINLTPGRCYVHVELLKGNVMADYVASAGHFDVEADDLFGTGMVPPRDWVLCFLGHTWWLNED
jgi:lipopolysaccharide transport system ATP-binding protein